MACSEAEHYHLFPSSQQAVRVSLAVTCVLVPPLASVGFEDGLHLSTCSFIVSSFVRESAASMPFYMASAQGGRSSR